jgi:hypothetical protein
MLICNIDLKPGFQFYGAVVGANCDLLESVLYERFVKLDKVYSLLFDEILQVGDMA